MLLTSDQVQSSVQSGKSTWMRTNDSYKYFLYLQWCLLESAGFWTSITILWEPWILSLERGIYIHSLCVCICAFGGFPDSSKLRLKTCALTAAKLDRVGHISLVGRNISLAKPPGLCKYPSINNSLQAQDMPPTEASSDKWRPKL